MEISGQLQSLIALSPVEYRQVVIYGIRLAWAPEPMLHPLERR